MDCYVLAKLILIKLLAACLVKELVQLLIEKLLVCLSVLFCLFLGSDRAKTTFLLLACVLLSILGLDPRKLGLGARRLEGGVH